VRLLLLLGLCAACVSAQAATIDVDDPRVSRAAPLWLLDKQPMTGELRRKETDGSSTVLPLRDGWLHGTVKSHGANGQPRSEGAFVQGQAEGVHRAWWPNGRLRSEQRFEQDRPHGLSTTWYPSGQRYEEHRYERGQEAGLQRVWFEDQRLRANYEVRNGRRYGNIGAMGCAGDDKLARAAAR
jgi:antitoxin component YwqK of YwqJK toxin-antitoxin module